MAERKQSAARKKPASKTAPQAAPESNRRLAQYTQIKPDQMSLFELLSSAEKRFSNTIELYDFMPKYHWGKVERIGGEFLRTLEREFVCRGKKYQLKIKPASIEDKDGVERYYYPSKREELIEDALRKFAVQGHGLFLDDQAGVTFTLYQLKKELQRNGHTYSIREIKDALYICQQTNLIVTNEDGTAILLSSIFETVGLQTREDWKGHGEKTTAFVRFNPLVTESIKNGSYRQFNYDKSMTYKNVIARQLHKRMSHHYLQADIAQPYTITLLTLIRDFGITNYSQLRDNLRQVETALREMQTKEVLLYFKIEKTVDAAAHNKLLDVKFVLAPHPSFRGEVVQANVRQKIVADKLAGGNHSNAPI